MRSWCRALCVLLALQTVAYGKPPLSHGQKVAAAGVALVATAWSNDFMWASTSVTFQNVCIACENYGPPPPTDYRPFYGIIPVAGAWIQLGRTAATFSDDGSSNAARTGMLMPYLVPGAVELVGLTLILVGSTQARRHR
jgi:hypothetical protein